MYRWIFTLLRAFTAGRTRKAQPQGQWRVQAFLLPVITGGAEYPYQPTYHTSEKSANEQVDKLERSFSPGHARIEREWVA